MKKLFLLALVPALAFSCGQRAKKATAEENLMLKDSIQMVEGLGAIVQNIYNGLIPAADGPGIDMTLTLIQQESAPTGVYHLKRTYIEGEDGKDKTFESTGSWKTLPTESHPIYVLTDYKNGEVSAFVFKGDTIEMLDQNMEPIVSDLNYTLKRIVQNEKVK